MKKDIKEYIKTWEERCYSNGIPDEVPTRIAQLNKAPSYRQICIAILKNDHSLKTLGFSERKSRYYHILKRMELDARVDGKPKQMKIKF